MQKYLGNTRRCDNIISGVIVKLKELSSIRNKCYYNQVKSNNTKEERNTPKNIQHDKLRSYCIQDKGSHFVFQSIN